MILISLLLVLAIERLIPKATYWHIDFYFSRYRQAVVGEHSLDGDRVAALWLILLLPVFGLYFIQQHLVGGIVELVLQTSVLLVCIGCPHSRERYKRFLQAANRSDYEACSHYAADLGHNGELKKGFGQSLVWVNYRHYTAVILWFIALGGAGAVLYVLARSFQQQLHQQHHPMAVKADQFMTVLDWVPARIAALGFIVIGDFTRSLSVWTGLAFKPSTPARSIVTEVAKAAEDEAPCSEDVAKEPCAQVALAKRNVMFLLVLISLLTLGGWIP